MKELVILLLIALVHNLQKDGLTVYNAFDLSSLSKDVYLLNVKNGEEFYISFSSNDISHSGYRLLSVPDGIEYLGLKAERPWSPSICRTTYYFKFKAMKPSYNKIVLRFKFSGFGETIYIKLNILN